MLRTPAVSSVVLFLVACAGPGESSRPAERWEAVELPTLGLVAAVGNLTVDAQQELATDVHGSLYLLDGAETKLVATNSLTDGLLLAANVDGAGVDEIVVTGSESRLISSFAERVAETALPSLDVTAVGVLTGFAPQTSQGVIRSTLDPEA